MQEEKKNIPLFNLIQRIFVSKTDKDGIVLKVTIGILLLAGITLMYPYGKSIEYSYAVGSVWTDKDLMSPFSFPIYKDIHQYEKEKEEAKHSIYPVFKRHHGVAEAVIETLGTTIETIRAAADRRQRWLKSHLDADSVKVEQTIRTLPFTFSDKEWTVVSRWRAAEKKGSAKPLMELERFLIAVCTEIYRAGIIDQAKMRQSPTMYALREKTTEEIVASQNVYDVEEAQLDLQKSIAASYGESDSASVANKIFRSFVRPNLLYDRPETERSTQIAMENVPKTLGFVEQNELIISTNDRITGVSKLKLESLYHAKADRGSGNSAWSQRLGIFLHVALIIGLFTIYLFLFRKKIFHNNGMLTLIGLLLLLETFFAFLSLRLKFEEPLQYLIVVPAASMLLTIIFDSRVAFYGTVTMAFLIAGIRGNDYTMALASLVAGALGAYTVRDIRNRTQIFRSLIFIFIGYAFVIISFALERFTSVDIVAKELTYALANAVVSPVLTYGLLIFFERVFRVTTDLTLLELSDVNHPLLQELSEKAPGTFHHSMTIGSLAEAAADDIGANSILARVGGYYHDIGKVLKPEYFVENQIGSINRHTRLKPRMSALIIASHVKEGVELGKQHGLPEKVLDFIPQHHGTTRMSFFFDKALKQAAARKNHKDVLNEDDFRYPGPKPQTRETGIVMLADSVEASTRSIAEMTQPKLESVIENMIKQRFVEGQLDECELTLRDLTKIREAFLKILLGIHHQRITYPEQEALETPVSSKPVEEVIQPQQQPVQQSVVEETKEQELQPPDQTV